MGKTMVRLGAVRRDGIAPGIRVLEEFEHQTVGGEMCYPRAAARQPYDITQAHFGSRLNDTYGFHTKETVVEINRPFQILNAQGCVFHTGNHGRVSWREFRGMSI